MYFSNKLRFAVPLAMIALAACSAETPPPAPAPAPPPPPVSEAPEPSYPGEETRVLSQVDAKRLLGNKGVTLQWIDWDTRGTAVVSQREGLWQLRGAQAEANGPGRLFLDGAILEIGEGYFTFRGTIRISDTPDRGRSCEFDKTWHFAVTQNRPYYRLREFEWCDYLTDYVDIYFAPTGG
ncbi:MAG: hypothetical protein R3D89_14500 [Sphingomonadaceae bacterium]